MMRRTQPNKDQNPLAHSRVHPKDKDSQGRDKEVYHKGLEESLLGLVLDLGLNSKDLNLKTLGLSNKVLLKQIQEDQANLVGHSKAQPKPYLSLVGLQSLVDCCVLYVNPLS